MNPNDDQDPPATAAATVPSASGEAPADASPAAGRADSQPGADGQPRGSDPPKQSGHPAARHAGDGVAPDGGGTGPADPNEIDRSTDA